MPQTTVNLTPDLAFVGQIADGGAPSYIKTGSVQGSGVLRGYPVMRGTDLARQVTIFPADDSVAPTLENLAGIVVLETSRALSTLITPAPPADGDHVPVMRQGAMYMYFGAAVNAGQNVKFKASTGDLEGIDIGGTPGTGFYMLPGVRIVETTTGAGVAKVEINLFGGWTA